MTSVEGLARLLERADGAWQTSGGGDPATRRALIQALLDRQVQAGRVAGLFTVTSADWERGPRLWTGEPIRTKLAAVHVYSQEATGLLARLGAGDPTVDQAVAKSAARLAGTCYALQHCTIGECATSFIGYVRLLGRLLGEGGHAEIAPRVQTLFQHRLGDGRWRRFPLFYTVLVLSELRLPAAGEELLYARAACLRAVRHNSVDEPFAGRRAQLMRAVFGEHGDSDERGPLHVPTRARESGERLGRRSDLIGE